MDKEQFEGWKGHPVTMEVMAELTKLRFSLSDGLSRGNTLSSKVDETALLTARIVGKIEGIEQILGLDYEEGDEDGKK